MMYDWISILATISLLAGIGSCTWISIDEMSRPQHMWIMNLVWPLVALSGSLAVVWVYLRWGRGMSGTAAMQQGDGHSESPFPVAVIKGTMHCGSGCTLGDLIAETLAFLLPAVAIYLGWHSIFQDRIFAIWVLDFLLAFVLGVVFQYYAIKPMRDLSTGSGIWAALKADTLSLTAWQVGMYGFMALAFFWIFPHLLGLELQPMSLEFWFMMQIAMICGFATAYPVNWWLIRIGIKEQM